MSTVVMQGASITLLAQFYEFAGGPPVDLTGVTITIESADGTTTVLAATSTGVAHPDDGVYTYVWDVPIGQDPGGYLATWSGTATGGGTVTATELITVAVIPTYAAQLAAARRYDRVPYRAETITGAPIPGAHATLWDAQTGGTQVTNITALDGSPIPGGILVADSGGWFPGFYDLNKTPSLYIIGSDTGAITGVDRVLIEPSDTDDRVIAIEAYVTGPGGISQRQDALETSRGQALGLATLGSDGRVSPEQLPGQLGGVLGYAVTDYGALGDGTNDDSAAIQAVLNLVADTAPGSKVVVPPGRYNLLSELEAKSAVALELMPGATLVRGSASMEYVIKNFNDTYSPTAYGGRGGIRIYGGGVIDAAGDTLSGAVTAVIFAHAKGVRVEGITIRNVTDWHFIEINSSQDVLIRDCVLEGFNPATAGRYYSEAIQVDLAQNSSALPGIGPGSFDNTPCDNVIVQDCTVRPYGSLGAPGKLVGSHSFADNVFHTRIRVANCYGTGLADYAVRAWNWWDAVIANNEFVNCNGAFMADVPASATVGHEGFAFIGNVCRGLGVQNGAPASLDYAVKFEGIDTPSVPIREVVVAANVFKTIANPQGALRFNNVADVVCSNNVIKDCTGATGRGIHIVGSAQGTYTGNKIVGTADRGIHVADGTTPVSTYCTFSGNTISATAGVGIDVNSAEPVITGNNVNGVTGGIAGIAVYTNALNATVTGNKVRKGSPGPTSGIEVRNAAMLMNNTVIGWTSNSTDNGASGQNIYVNTGGGGSAFPTAVRTYNKCS